MAPGWRLYSDCRSLSSQEEVQLPLWRTSPEHLPGTSKACSLRMAHHWPGLSPFHSRAWMCDDGLANGLLFVCCSAETFRIGGLSRYSHPFVSSVLFREDRSNSRVETVLISRAWGVGRSFAVLKCDKVSAQVGKMLNSQKCDSAPKSAPRKQCQL